MEGYSWLISKQGRPLGNIRWVFSAGSSREQYLKKSAAVGTGAIALRPLVDIVMSTGQGEAALETKILGQFK
jgi:hypothetical protein